MSESLSPLGPHPSPLPTYRARGRDSAFAIHPWHIVAITLIVLLGGCLRFHNIDKTSVWCDELLSIHISNAHNFAVDRLPRDVLIRDLPDLMSLANAQPAWKVWGTMGGDMHPPLYYLTLRLWRDVFGDSPLGIRSLSAVLGTLALLAVFFAGREMAGTVVGLWAALLNALAFEHIYYSQEARMYAFAMLWTTAAMAIVFRIGRLGFNRRRGVALAAFCVGGMLTLYLSSAVLFAAAAYILVRFRGKQRANTFLCFVAAALVFAIAWVPFLYTQQFHALKSDWLKADPSGLLATTLDRIALLPMNQLVVTLPSGDKYGYIFATIYVLPLLFVRKMPQILLPWLAVSLVAGIPAAADLLRTTNMLFWSRYTVLMVPSLSLSIVGLSWQLKPRLRWLLPAGLVLFCTVSLPAVYQKERFDFRNNALVAEQASLHGEGRLIFMSTWNEKFDSVLLLACQYFWKTPPREAVFVESYEGLNRLPANVQTDRVILVAGDRNADFTKVDGFALGKRETWAVGVGSVNTFVRATTPTTAPSTQPAAEPGNSGVAR